MENYLQTLSQNIKIMAKEFELSQTDFLEECDVSRSFLSNMKRSTPTIDKILNISKYTNCSIDYLLGLSDVKEIITSENLKKNIPEEDQHILDKYHNLTTNNKSIVDYIFGLKEESVEPIIRYESIFTDDVIYLPLVEQKASAGIGDATHQSSNEEDKVCFPKNKIPNGATHAIIIDGHSMEPTFFDEQIVFINAEQDCNDGDYGIYEVIQQDKTDIYCKQLRRDKFGRKYLHSVSNSSDDPEITEEEGTILKCIGKIIRK